MSKSAQRRRASRVKLLLEIAANDEERFHREMNLRLASWVREIRNRVGRFATKDGTRVPAAYEVVERAVIELESLATRVGDARVRRIITELEAEYVRAVGQVYERHLPHRLQSPRFR